MTIDMPIVQTYVEIKYIKPGSTIEVAILSEIVEVTRNTLYEQIGIRDDISGRATYSIGSKGVYVKIWIDQYMNTLNSFNANSAVQAIMANLVDSGYGDLLFLESVVEYENLNGEILVPCPDCKGTGQIAGQLDAGDCWGCEGYAITFTNDPKVKIVPMATRGF